MGNAGTSAKPVRLSCYFESVCPFFDARERDGEGQKDGERAQKVDSEKIGKAGASGIVSHCLTMVA